MTRLVGQQSVFTATFRNDEGDLVDPATVTFLWRHSGSDTEDSFDYGDSGEVVKVSTGVYKFTAPPFDVGVNHFVRVKSTSPITATEVRVPVAPSTFTG